MDVRCPCPECDSEVRIPDAHAGAPLVCKCGWTGKLADPLVADAGLNACPVCGTEDLYLQKDFPERVGFALVMAGVVGASYFWYHYSALGAIGVLIGFGVLDWIFFHTRPDVVICYRCLSQFRGVPLNPAHRAFDLAVHERYRQERLRKERLRVARQPGAKPLPPA